MIKLAYLALCGGRMPVCCQDGVYVTHTFGSS